MPDNDAIALEEAADAAFAIGVAYRDAVNANDFATMAKLKPEADRAHDAYSAARLKLLAPGVLATNADIAALKQIRANIDAAANTQDMVNGALQLIGFLMKFA